MDIETFHAWANWQNESNLSLPDMGLGLELRERVFFGVPGGVRGGVTPFPFTLLSPDTEKHNW